MTSPYPAPDNPMAVARQIIAEIFTGDNGELLAAYCRGEWRERQDDGTWSPMEEAEMRAHIYLMLEDAYFTCPLQRVSVPWNPDLQKVDNVLDAMAAALYTRRPPTA